MKKIIVDLKIPISRYIFFIVLFLNKSGYQIFLNKKNIFKIKNNEYKYFNKISSLNVNFIDNLPKNISDFEYITNYNKKELKKKYQSIYFLNNYYHPKLKKKGMDVPYFMHPLIYINNKDNLKINLKKQRIKKVLFFGYPINHPRYRTPFNKIFFNKFSRYDVCNYIYSNFLKSDRKSVYFFPKKRADFNNYLTKLQKYDFYLCPPGAIFPFSHNIIETMSVGTIPVLQYPELFSPKLKDKVNCLVYNNLDDFYKINSYIKNISFNEILKLRQNVYKYYTENLKLENLFNRKNNDVYYINFIYEKINNGKNRLPFNLKLGFLKNLKILFNKYFVRYIFRGVIK